MDFLDVNKSHKKKTYQYTNDYNKLAEVLTEFQMKLNSASLEVETYTIQKSKEYYFQIYIYIYAHTYIQASLVAQSVKNLPANAEDSGSFPELGRSPGEGNGNSLQYSCLENPHGQRGLVGYSPWDCKTSDTTERLTVHICICVCKIKYF